MPPRTQFPFNFKKCELKKQPLIYQMFNYEICTNKSLSFVRTTGIAGIPTVYVFFVPLAPTINTTRLIKTVY